MVDKDTSDKSVQDKLNHNLKFKSARKVAFKELEPSSNKDIVNGLKNKSTTENVNLIFNNKSKKSQSTSILNIVKHLSSKTVNLISKKSGDSCFKNKKKQNHNILSNLNNIEDSDMKKIISVVSNISDDEYSSDNENNKIIDVERKMASKKSYKQNTYDNIIVEMTNMFEQEMTKNFIDSMFNLTEYFEQYLIRNLKVIKRMQFFFSDVSYDDLFNIVLDKFNKNNYENFNFDYSKPYMFIDLDETLVHTEEYNELNKSEYASTFTIPFIEDNKEQLETFGVYIRPYCIEFLEFLKTHFKLVLFTAAEKNYAKFVLNSLKIDHYFDQLLDRSYTIQFKKFYIKDLSIFNKEEKLNCLLIDNNIFSMANSLQQGILVTSYYNNKDDVELKETINYLKEHIINNIENMIYVNDDHFMYRELMVKLDYETEVE